MPATHSPGWPQLPASQLPQQPAAPAGGNRGVASGQPQSPVGRPCPAGPAWRPGAAMWPS